MTTARIPGGHARPILAHPRVPRALVVDDEMTIRAALTRFLGRRGWECDEAEHGLSARQRIAARDGAYEVIVCDIRMPVMNGVELHDWLAEEYPVLLDRMLLIAGDVTSAEVAEFLQRTRCRLLHKPFDLPELANAVDSLYGSSAGTS